MRFVKFEGFVRDLREPHKLHLNFEVVHREETEPEVDLRTVCGALCTDAGRITSDDLLCGDCCDGTQHSADADFGFRDRPALPPIELQLEEYVAMRLTRMRYSDYLRTQHWRYIRSLALHHYGASCVMCNAGDHLQVHHRTYDRRGHERLDDLIVLCDDCHSKYHGKADSYTHAPLDISHLQAVWNSAVLPAVESRSAPARAVFVVGTLASLNGGVLTIEFPPSAWFHRKQAENPKYHAALVDALYQVTGRTFSLALEVTAA